MSVNPARSTGPASFVGDWPLQQLWMFWLAPVAGAVLAGVVYSLMFASREAPAVKGVNEHAIGTVAPGA